ncbi:MAG: two-component regulator propeller domain-containing protein [Bacteroidales bacterium]
MKCTNLFVLLCLLLFTYAPSFSSSFNEISTKEGLSNRKVFAVTKDSKGYVWFATRSGIDRYNGEKIKTYSLHLQQTTEKPKAVFSDPTGNIFAITDKQVYRFIESLDKFVCLNDIKLKGHESLTMACFTQNGELWIGTTENLYSIPDSKEMIRYELPVTSAVYCLVEEKNRLWIGTSNGIVKLNTTSPNNYIISSENGLRSLKKQRIQSLFYDEMTKKLWIGTFASGIKTYDLETRKLTGLDDLPYPVRKITVTSESKIWVGFDGAGITEFNRFTGEKLQEYSQSSHSFHYLKANGVYDIFNDDIFIWVCTYTAGVQIYNKSELVYKLYQQNSIQNHQYTDNHVNALLEDSQQNLWIGTNNGIKKYNNKTQIWEDFQKKQSKHLSVILSLFEDSSNNLWVGGYAGDLLRINVLTGESENIQLPQSSHRKKHKNYIYTIAEDKSKNLWFGGIVNDLTKYNPKKKSFETYKLRSINIIHNFSDDSLLIGTSKGLSFFDLKTEKNIPVVLSHESSLKNVESPIVTCIWKDIHQPSVYWIGTEGNGVFAVRRDMKIIKQYTMQEGLSSNTVWGIQNDKLGRLWISTENGLNCMSLNNNHIANFYEIDGLPDNSFNYRAYTIRENGNMVWGTPSGAVEINPENYTYKQTANLNLHFEEFSLYNQKVTSECNGSPLQTAIDSTSQIELNHNQHSFSFDFMNLNYFNNSNLLYSWKLEGFDTQWSLPSTTHRATYTNIEPGKYRFRVKTFQPNKENETAEREIELLIHPPFWATWWAFSMYLLTACVILYFLIKFYKKRLEAKDSDLKIRFFVNIAHDIRTPLTLIKAPLNELENESLSDHGMSALILAKKNTEKLLKMVSQLLDFQKIEREAMRLHIESTDLKIFLENTVAGFLILAKEKQINLQVQFPAQPVSMTGWIDRQKITVILDNLLSNAIKYTKQHGNILVKASVHNDHLKLEITDDGIGISLKDQQKLFTRFYRAQNTANSTETGSGIGLLLTKKMVLLHKGVITFSSTEGVGTTFSIFVPVAKQAYLSSQIVYKQHQDQLVSQKENEDNDELQSRFKILLVEDNSELRAYLAQYLMRTYIVEEATNGSEALDLIKKGAPDFILSDVVMPEISGVELCTRLKTNIETCHIPIILLTSLADREDIIKGFNSGADDYITKPFDLSVLESKISSILKNRARYRKKYIDRSAFSDESSIANDLDKKFMGNLVEYIEENMVNDDFSIDSLAIEMAMSRSVFYKKIKSLTGQNPKDFIRDIKMKKAANLLREEKYSIGEIAYLTGYPNAKYFSTAFKKYFGTSPSVFNEKEKAEFNE